jgi:hypothetical protein
MYTRIQALELRTTAGHARLPRVVGERVHGAQISQGSAPRMRCRRGTTTHPPTARLGLQSVLLQFNQRSYRRVVEYVRGVKNVHARRPHRGPVPKQSTVRGRIKPCKRWRTEQTEQTFPKGSSALNFGYHVRAELLTRTTSRSSQGAPSALRVPQASDFPR